MKKQNLARSKYPPCVVTLAVGLFLTSPCYADRIWRLNQTPQQHQQSVDTLAGRGYVPVYLAPHVVDGKLTFDQLWVSTSGRVEWEMRSALTEQQFAAKDREMNFRGLALQSHCRYSRNGTTFHTAIWQRGDSLPPTASRVGLSVAEHQRMTEELAREGFTPVLVKPAAKNGDVYVDAVFQKRTPKREWELRSTLNDEQYRLKDKDLSQLGFRQIWHHTYRVNGKRLHATVWEKR